MTSGRDKMAAPNKRPHFEEAYIALLGVTGAGKTTFARHASDDTTLQIGHGIYSCTREPRVIRFRLPDGYPIALIDTPGFDDDTHSDVEILEQLARWMAEQKEVIRKRLSGIILLQPITAHRVGGTERKRTRLLKNILGEDAYKHVIIATTMWEQIKDKADMEERLRGRREDLWSDMVQRGTRIVEHANNKKSAHMIIRMIIDTAATSGKVKPLLEMELAKNPRIVKTTAGKEVKRQLEANIRHARNNLKEHKKEEPKKPKDSRTDNSEENARARIFWNEWWEERKVLQDELRLQERRLKRLNSLSFKVKLFLVAIMGGPGLEV